MIEVNRYYVSGQDNDLYVLAVKDNLVYGIEYSNRHDCIHLEVWGVSDIEDNYIIVDDGYHDFAEDLSIDKLRL